MTPSRINTSAIDTKKLSLPYDLKCTRATIGSTFQSEGIGYIFVFKSHLRTFAYQNFLQKIYHCKTSWSVRPSNPVWLWNLRMTAKTPRLPRAASGMIKRSFFLMHGYNFCILSFISTCLWDKPCISVNILGHFVVMTIYRMNMYVVFPAKDLQNKLNFT